MSESQSLSGEWTVPARHYNVGQATETLLEVVSAAGYSTVATGSNSFRLARTYRPRWATVSTIVGTVLLLGLGLFFLLVKRTEMADASVTEERDGVKLRISGTLSGRCLSELQSRLEGRTPAPQVLAKQTVASLGPSAFAPLEMRMPRPTFSTPDPDSVVALDSDRTITSAQLRSMRQRAPSNGVSYALRFSTGEVIDAHRGAVIGRDPAPDEELPNATRIAIADDSLSKTHLTVGPTTRGVWVTDRHSTNGAAIFLHGATTPCPPGAKVEVPVGGKVVFGDRSFVVEAVS